MELYADSPEAPLRLRNTDAEPPSPKHELSITAAVAAPGEDADAAFARLCAEQERAFYLMTRSGGGGAEAAPDAAEAPEEEEDADAALARMLAAEEEAAFESRLLALAGLPPPGAAPDADAVAAEAAADDADAADAEEGPDVDALSYEQLLALGDAVGSVSKGCSAAAVARLERRLYTSAEGGESLCAICRFDFVAGDGLVVLPCGHAFHEAECGLPWLALQRVCPCCKAEVPRSGGTPARG